MADESAQNEFDYVWGDAATFIVHDVPVSDSGRVTIPNTRRERYGVGHNDYVHLVVHVVDDGGDDVFRINDAQIGRKGQVTIPARQRDRYGLDIGDTVTIEVLTEG